MMNFFMPENPCSVVPFGQVLWWVSAGKRGTGRGVQGRGAGPLPQAAGIWTSTLTAALGTALCPARLLRQCRHAEREQTWLPGIPTSPEPYMSRLEMLCTRRCPMGHKRASLVVCLILLGALRDRVIPHKMPGTSLMAHT